ncbi:MAG: diaminopimelate decarboxylase [Candidatus Firestonebacteria bacterium]|nr:diaminopimelate decarboxylase [Candidatus Firestonebacteria bacterium]
MDEFKVRQGELFCEEIPVLALVKKYGTPLYVYSRATLLSHFHKIQTAFAPLSPLICYSVKANSNLSILKELAAQGAGMDIVSGGELVRVQTAGVPAARVVYAGVGKTRPEIAEALRAGILMFNVESEPELQRINHVAGQMKKVARVALRINPDVDAKTHQYITTGTKENKFGLSIPMALGLFREARKMKHVSAVGVHMHIGSQITSVTPYLQALKRLSVLVDELRAAGHALEYLNMGGGMGIIYDEEQPQTADAFARAVVPLIRPLGLKLILEPGRFIVGNAGVLLTSVQYVKRGHVKSFVIVDAGMNDLIRPSLYHAHHQIFPVKKSRSGRLQLCDVVGPICESGDFLGKDRHLPPLAEGDVLAVRSTGAYGMAMASNYNSRLRAAEVLVSGSKAAVIRRRETMADVLATELGAAKAKK